VLVGTTSIEASELPVRLLTQAGLKHEVLNAKQHAREAAISRKPAAGRRHNCNEHGRSRYDIVLGGNVEKQSSFIDADESLSDEEKQRRIKHLEDEWQNAAPIALRVGRAAYYWLRNGTNRVVSITSCADVPDVRAIRVHRFYLSLDDPLLRILRRRSPCVRSWTAEDAGRRGDRGGIVTRSIESAQRKVEARNFDIRKQLLEYDDVSNDQRKVIYQKRNELLEATDVAETITRHAPKRGHRGHAHLLRRKH